MLFSVNFQVQNYLSNVVKEKYDTRGLNMRSYVNKFIFLSGLFKNSSKTDLLIFGS